MIKSYTYAINAKIWQLCLSKSSLHSEFLKQDRAFSIKHQIKCQWWLISYVFSFHKSLSICRNKVLKYHSNFSSKYNVHPESACGVSFMYDVGSIVYYHHFAIQANLPNNQAFSYIRNVNGMIKMTILVKLKCILPIWALTFYYLYT